MNDRDEVEKSLKRFLKKKIAYTAGLLVAFLITGAIGFASSAELASQAGSAKETLLADIAAQKAEVQALIDENEARLKELKTKHFDLLNEGDWYSKAWYPSYFLSFLGNYTKADHKSKEYITSNRPITEFDKRRYEYDPTSINKYYAGSGWIMNTDTWNSFTQVYDNEAKLTIIPVVKTPEVGTPTTPTVAFNVPKSPASIPAPSASVPTIATINVTASAPAVSAPTLAVIPVITPPTLATVAVSQPSVTVTPPTVSVSPMAPVIAPPTAPVLPNINLDFTPMTITDIPEFNALPAVNVSVKEHVIPDPVLFTVPHGNPVLGVTRAINPLDPSVLWRSYWGTPQYPTTDPQWAIFIAASVTGGDYKITNTGGSWTGATDEYGTIPAAQTNFAYTGLHPFWSANAKNHPGNNMSGVTAYFGQNAKLSLENAYMAPGDTVGTFTGMSGFAMCHNNVTVSTDYVLQLDGDVTTKGDKIMVLYQEPRYERDHHANGWSILNVGSNSQIITDEHGKYNVIYSGLLTYYDIQNGLDWSVYAGQFNINGQIEVRGKNSKFASLWNRVPSPAIDPTLFVSSGIQIKIDGTGSVKLYGAENIGIEYTGDNPRPHALPATKFLLTNPIEIQGDNSIGLNIYKDSTTWYTLRKAAHPGETLYDLRFRIGTEVDGVTGDQLYAGNYDDGLGTVLDPKKVENVVGVVIQNGEKFELDSYDIKFGAAAKDGVMFYVENGEIKLTNTVTTKIVDAVNTADPGEGSTVAYVDWKHNAGTYAVVDIYNGAKITIDPDVEMWAKAAKAYCAVNNGEIVVNGNTEFKNGGINDGTNIDYTVGFFGNNSGKLTYNNTSLKFAGDYSIGGYLDNSSVLTMPDNSTVTMAGDESIGFYAKHASNITIGTTNAGTFALSMAGDKTRGLVASGTSSLIDQKNQGTMTFTGTTDGEIIGIYANDGGEVKSNTDISITTGKKSYGVAAMDANSKVTLNGDVSLTGGDSSYLICTKDGNIEITGDLTITGDKSAGIYAKSSTVPGTGKVKVTFDTISISGDDSTGFYIDKGAITLKGNGGTGTVNFSGSNSVLFYNKTTTDSVILDGNITMNVGADGIAFYCNDATGMTVNSFLQNLFDTTNGTITVNVANNAYGFVIKKLTANVSDLQAVSIPNIVVTGNYKSMLYKSDLTVDLDSDIDKLTVVGDKKYRDVLIGASKITLATGKSINGTENALVAIAQENDNTGAKADVTLTNKGIVTLTGTDSIGMYSSYGIIDNRSDLNMSNNSIGIIGVNGTEVSNTGNITVGNNGLGIIGLPTKVDNLGNLVTQAFGTDAGAAGNVVDIDNSGNITITGDNGIGIYVANNSNKAQNLIQVSHSGKIEAIGNNNIGISMLSSAANIGGELTLSSVITGPNIKLGNNGIGIYTEDSNVNFASSFGIEVKDNSTGIYVKGNSNVTSASGTFTLDYTGSDTGSVNAMIYDLTSASAITNNLDLAVNIASPSLNTTGTVSGIYIKSSVPGSSLTNNGNITIANEKAYGIISEGVDITNNGIIQTGIAGKDGGIGVYTKDANVMVFGENIQVLGEKAIGVYAESTPTLGTVKSVTVNTAAGTLNVDEKNSIGIYLKDVAGGKLQLVNNANIALTPSSADTDRRIGIFLENASNTLNENNGNINVNDYNIGIHGIDSYIKNSGTINVNGKNNIGISMNNSGQIDLASGAINLASVSMLDPDISFGIYANGNGIDVTNTSGTTNILATPNTIGIYLDGNNSKTVGQFAYTLSSENTADKIAIGAYYKNGAYGDAANITVTSSSTAVNTNGAIRPIGLYYGSGSTVNRSNVQILSGSNEVIGIYGDTLTFTNDGNISVDGDGIGGYFKDSNVTNNGSVVANANNSYGLYFKGGNSTVNSTVDSNGANSIGVTATGANTTVENTATGTISSNGSGSLGAYTEDQAKFINRGILNTGISGIGAFANNYGTVENTNNINSQYIGMYGKNNGIVIQSAGQILMDQGIGIFAEGNGTTASLTGGNISASASAGTGITGVAAEDNAVIYLNGTDIQMNDGSLGVSLNNGSTGIFTLGNITVGQSGTGIYGKNSVIDITNYTGTITMGNKGIGIYAEDAVLNSGASLKINYSGTDKGVGLYIKGTAPFVNNTTIDHTGNNLVHIYGNGSDMTNTAAQTIFDDGIGIYGDSGAMISNTGTLDLQGQNTIGIYLDNATLKDIGTITGSAVTPGNSKVGVFVSNGDVVGNTDYNFGVQGGIGIFLKNNTITYDKTVNITGDSPSSTERTIGIYADATLTGTINTKMNITGADAIGLYLDKDTVSGSAANITYEGELTISGTSTGNRGLGAYLAPDTIFDLGTNGKINIGGTNNIGFYVSNGGNLNITGGEVVNTVDGIFAYIDGGNLTFAAGSMPNINYANVIVSGTTGNIINDTTITVGNGGLQGDNGSAITNTLNGVINGSSADAKGMVGTGSGTVLTNDGNINLTGQGSVGMYVENGAVGNSSGNIIVGDKAVAYYAGTGGTINISGTGSVGEDSSFIYAGGGNVNYTGADIALGGNRGSAITISDAASTVDLNGKNITVRNEGTGIFVTGTGNINNVLNIGNIEVGESGTGVFIDTTNNTVLSNDINLMGTGAIGILTTQNIDIDYNGTIRSTFDSTKGIVSNGTGNIRNNGIISVKGGSNIGIYGENATSITNTSGALIELGDGTESSSSIGLYGKNANTVNNDGTIKMSQYGVGIYGENSVISNTGTIQNDVGNNTGIYGIGGSANNSGTVSLGNTSNGIFVKDGSVITNTGDISVGDNRSAGIYGAGTTSVSHLGGTITVGKDSVGIATDDGDITVAAGAAINAGEGSTYIYTRAGMGTNNQDMVLNSYGVGMYTKRGHLINNAAITLGASDVSSTPVKVSVGMVGESGKIENNGTINMPYDYGVGMVVNDGGIANNNGTINVSGANAHGMQGTNNSEIYNIGTINVDGMNSRGIAALNSTKVYNSGTINVNGANTEGIFVETGSTVDNTGNIYVNGAAKTGIYIGSGGTITNSGNVVVTGSGQATIDGSGTLVNVGAITINGPDISIDGVAITNTGTITVNGPLDFGTVRISGSGTNPYIGTISAETFGKGQFTILPDVTQGSNKEAYIVQYLQGTQNVPNNGQITAISQSVSYVVDLQKDPTDSDKISIVLVKVPYEKMTEQTEAVNFGKGLDELYVSAQGRELQMFDSLDRISNDDQLASTMENEIRGNEYANIQDRMTDITDVFNNSYENLKHSRLYTKDELKVGAIMKKGESKYSKPAINDYDAVTTGAMVMKEYDTRTFGSTYGWNIGFSQTKFDFDNDSEETVYSGNFGLSYERFVGNPHVKWFTRGEVTINHHETDRKIDIDDTRYKNTGKFWSGIAVWKNKLRHEQVSDSGVVKVGVQGTMDLGYGKYFNFAESGDGMELKLPSTNMYTVRPGVGADVTFTARTKSGSKLSLAGKASYEYELGKIYDGANKVQFKNTTADHYKLEEPKKERGIVKVGAELRYERRTGTSIGFEIMRQEGRRDNTTYGANFMMRLGN